MFIVDGWNNFCRVFELPTQYPNDFCFGGGISVNFQMVDWFYPVSNLPNPAVSKAVWLKEVGKIKTTEITTEELNKKLIPFLLKKQYIKKGREYLVLCDFGAAIKFIATQ